MQSPDITFDAMPKDSKRETITLRVPEGMRAELERKRRNAGERSVNAYVVKMLQDGKCNGHKKKP